MKSRRHFSSVWIAFLLGAGAILIWNTAARINRLDYLSTIGAPAENHTGGVTGSAPGDAELTPNNSLPIDRKSTRLNSSHLVISYAVFCLKKQKIGNSTRDAEEWRRGASVLEVVLLAA